MNTKHLSNLLPKFVLGAALATGLGLPIAGPLSAVRVAHAEDDLPDVPRDAKRVEESKSSATFKVPGKGQVWLYDVNTKDVIHSITVNPGNTYSFDTSKDLVLVDKTHGPKMDLDPKHTYRIYYVNFSDRKGVEADKKDLFDIPKRAKHVADGKGVDLKFSADADGTLYLVDRTAGELVNVFRVRDGEAFVVEPTHDRVVVNDKIELKNAGLKTDIDYRLWFLPHAK